MNLGGDELALILYITIEKKTCVSNVYYLNYNIHLYTYIKCVHAELIFIRYNIYLYMKVLKHIIVNNSKNILIIRCVIKHPFQNVYYFPK